MIETPIKNSFANAHVAWLGCLYATLRRIRIEGLLSIENEVDKPEHSESIFQCFPQTQMQPYLEFATDVMRMMVSGSLNPDEMKIYVEFYIGGLLTNGGVFSNEVDESLLRTIWLTLWATMCGHPPEISCEFGRQAIPYKLKPTATELEELLHGIRARVRWQGVSFSDGGLDAAVDSFVSSLGRS